MHKLIVPSEVKISEILANGSLSPNNYKKLTIKNPNQHYASFYLGSTEKLEITRKQEKNKVYKRFSCIYNTPKYGISVKNHTFWGR